MAIDSELIKLLATGGSGVAITVVALKGYDVVSSILNERKMPASENGHQPLAECVRRFDSIDQNLGSLTKTYEELNAGRTTNGEKLAEVGGKMDILISQMDRMSARIDGVINGRH